MESKEMMPLVVCACKTPKVHANDQVAHSQFHSVMTIAVTVWLQTQIAAAMIAHLVGKQNLAGYTKDSFAAGHEASGRPC